MFIDRVKIRVKAGDGGKGCVAFRREKGVPEGGPSGGDGGNGGSVILIADRHMRTLIDFQFRPEFKAGRGQHGLGSQCHGWTAENLIARVPLGTVVRDVLSGSVLADLVKDGDSFLAAKGGRGGRGNMNFASSTRQAPRWAEPGTLGEERMLELELRILADVGLLGLPNAGKSLLLSKVSAARPEVAAYPFTTKSPNLGVVSLGKGESFVVADLPGLIEGAHDGVGLGHAFLRHVSRTKVLVHVVDVGWEKTAKEMEKEYDIIVAEIRQYDADLVKRPRIVVGNKMDMPGAKKRFDALVKHAKKRGVKVVYPMSALTGEGVDRVVRAMQKALADAPEPVLKLPGSGIVQVLRPKGLSRVRVVLDQRGRFLVLGKEVERASARAESKSAKSLKALHVELKKLGVEDALLAAGAKTGDEVRIGDMELEFEPD